MGYSLQGNRKTREGDSHPDRNAQFEYINGAVGAALAERQPVISVDTKKVVGDFKNSGREYLRRVIPKKSGARLPDQGTRPGGAVRRL